MISLVSAFCCGLCSGAAVYSFTEGNIGVGLVNLGLALFNAMLAIKNYNYIERN